MKNTQQGFGAVGAIIIVVLLVIAGLWVAGDKNPGEEVQEDTTETQGIIETGLEAIEDAEDIVEQAGEGEQAVSGGTYTDYSEGVLAQGPDTQVLFFNATWCSSCRSLERSILSEKSLPEGVAVYKVDYDSNPDLKAKYGVRTQHTLVQVDREGNLVTKWSGGNNTESILKKIKA
jgi:thiol-disulfide isomerase/thioredoxin